MVTTGQSFHQLYGAKPRDLRSRPYETPLKMRTSEMTKQDENISTTAVKSFNKMQDDLEEQEK
jgi:hypothetical protein